METAKEIIASGTDLEEDSTPTIEEEFRDLNESAVSAIDRMTIVTSRLESQKDKPATCQDLATLYQFVAGDIGALLRDFIQASGAAFNDAFEAIDSDGDGNDEDDDDDDGSLGDSVQVYATLLANVEAFTNLKALPGIPEGQVSGFEQMILLNQSALSLFDGQFGKEISEQAQEYLKKAKEEAVTNG